MAYYSAYTQKSRPLHSVQEENEDVPPPPPPRPYFFVFPEQIFGGWPYFTPGTGSQGSTIRNNSYRKSWGPDRYYEYGNGNGNHVATASTRYNSADDLDGQDSYTQYENNEHNSMTESRGSGLGGWTFWKTVLLLLAIFFVVFGVGLLALQVHSYCDPPANEDNVSNFQGGKAYCTCECEDLVDLFALRSYYQSQAQVSAMMQRIGRRD